MQITGVYRSQRFASIAGLAMLAVSLVLSSLVVFAVAMALLVVSVSLGEFVSETGTVEIDDTAIRILDTRGIRDAIPRDSIRGGSLVRADDAIRLHLETASGGHFHMRVEDEAEGESLLTALGLPPSMRMDRYPVTRYPLGNGPSAALMLTGVLLGVAIPDILPKTLVASTQQHLGTAILAVLASFVGLPALAMHLPWLLAGAAKEIRVATDGIAVARLGRDDLVLPYSRVRSVELEGDKLVVREVDGLVHRWKMSTPRKREPPQVDARTRIEEKRALHDAGGVDSGELLAPNGGSKEWLGMLRTLVGKSEQAFRELPVTREDLRRVVESAAPPARRLAAAIALRAASDEEEKKKLSHLRVESADPGFAARFRVAVSSDEQAALVDVLEEQRRRDG